MHTLQFSTTLHRINEKEFKRKVCVYVGLRYKSRYIHLARLIARDTKRLMDDPFQCHFQDLVH